jgi:hypothetical protein
MLPERRILPTGVPAPARVVVPYRHSRLGLRDYRRWAKPGRAACSARALIHSSIRRSMMNAPGSDSAIQAALA